MLFYLFVFLHQATAQMAPPALGTVAQDDPVRLLILEALRILRSDHFEDYFDLFTDDAVWMMPNSKKDIGLEEARSFYGFTDKFRFDQQADVEELVVERDWAFARITFDGYLRSKHDDSPPLRSVSRHIWVMRREGRGWKIARDIWNTPRD